MADGSLGSDSWRNTLNFQENTIRYLRFQAGLMNKAGYSQYTPIRVRLLIDFLAEYLRQPLIF